MSKALRKSSRQLDYSSSLEEYPLFEHFEPIGKKIRAESNVSTWIEKLKQHLFEDKLSLVEDVTSEDWVAMGLPIRLLIELRKVAREKRSEKKNTQTIVEETISDIHSLTREKFKESLNLIDRKKTNIRRGIESTFNASSAERRDRERGDSPKIPTSQTAFNLSSLSNNNNNNNNTSKELVEISCNVVGAEALSTQFIKASSIFFSSLNQVASALLLEIYRQKVKYQLFSCGDSAESDCSIILLIFSVIQPHTLDYLLNSMGKHLPTFKDKKTIDVPIVLIGIDSGEREAYINEGKKVISTIEGDRAAVNLKALQYVEVQNLKNAQNLGIVFNKFGRAALRYILTIDNPKYQDVASEIYRTMEYENLELILKKKHLKFVPNSVLHLQKLQRLKINNNAISFFPTELKHLTNLMELDLSNNLIEEILPDDLSHFQSLVKLNLENNRLENLPLEQIKKMKKLLELRARGNPLSLLPSRLRRKNNLLETKVAAPKKLPVFGVKIEQKVEEDRYYYPNLFVPKFVDAAVNWLIANGLPCEGIFRLSGKANTINKLRENFATSTDICFTKDLDPFVVASILKQYLRELPEPAFPFDVVQDIVATLNLNNTEQLKKLKEIIQSLPIENFHLLRTIFHLMHLVALHSEVNLMTNSNLCKMLAPNILRQPPSNAIDISLISCSNTVIETIADNYIEIFESDFNPFDQEIPLQTYLHRKIQLHKHPITSMCLTDGNNYLWTADTKGNCIIWNAETYQLVNRFEASSKKINILCAIKEYVWVGATNSIQIHEADTGKMILQKDMDLYQTFIAVNSQIWISTGTSIRVLEYDTAKLITEFVRNGIVTALCQTNEEHVWSASIDHKIQIWDIKTFKLVEEINSTHERKVNDIKAMSTNEIWTMGDDSVICAWDARTFSRINRLVNFHNTAKVYGACKVGENAWSFSWNNEVHIWDIATHGHLGKLEVFHNDSIVQIICKWNVGYRCWEVFTSSYDRSIEIWLVRNNALQDKHKALMRSFWSSEELLQVKKSMETFNRETNPLLSDLKNPRGAPVSNPCLSSTLPGPLSPNKSQWERSSMHLIVDSGSSPKLRHESTKHSRQYQAPDVKKKRLSTGRIHSTVLKSSDDSVSQTSRRHSPVFEN